MTRPAGRKTAAYLGGGALIAMGIVGAMSGGADISPAIAGSGGSMMTGATTTVTYSGVVEPVVAKPVVKAKPYSG